MWRAAVEAKVRGRERRPGWFVPGGSGDFVGPGRVYALELELVAFAPVLGAAVEFAGAVAAHSPAERALEGLVTD